MRRLIVSLLVVPKGKADFAFEVELSAFIFVLFMLAIKIHFENKQYQM